jgi:RHS repeat-associated protein
VVWNADGTQASKTTAGVTRSNTWTAQDRLASVNQGATSVASMVYWPGGQRALLKDAGGTRVYFGGLAERHATSNTSIKNTRYHTLAGTMIASRNRTNAGTVTVDFYFGDIRGSTSLSVRRGSTTRELAWYDPYGKPRSAASIAGTERGYIGQYEDAATGLSYLNNRYMDPQLGVFLSVDPLVAKTGEPYLYASGNPATLSDPSGLCAADDGSGSRSSCVRRFFKDRDCILKHCAGRALTDAISRQRGNYGGLVFSLLEGADDKGAQNGDWSIEDIRRAADGDLDEAFDGMGLTGSSNEDGLKSVAQSVAKRLEYYEDAVEQIDTELSWWHKHGATLLTVAFITFAVAGVIASGGVLLAGSGAVIAGTGGVTWGTAAAVATTGTYTTHAVNISVSCLGEQTAGCGNAVGSLGVDVVTFGMAKGSGRVVGGVSEGFGYSSLSQASAVATSNWFFAGAELAKEIPVGG